MRVTNVTLLCNSVTSQNMRVAKSQALQLSGGFNPESLAQDSHRSPPGSLLHAASGLFKQDELVQERIH